MFARLKRDLASRGTLRHYDREGEDSGAKLDLFARLVEADLRAGALALLLGRIELCRIQRKNWYRKEELISKKVEEKADI